MIQRSTDRTEVAPGFTVSDLRDYDNKSVLPELSSGTDITGERNAIKELLAMGNQNGFKVLFFGPMKETIIGLCRELGMPYASTYELIPGGKYPEEYLVHYMHPKKEGHGILAEYLEKDIVRRCWIPAVAGSQQK